MSKLAGEIQALPVRNTASVRAIRRHYSRKLKQETPAFVLDLARELLGKYGQWWVAYELVRYHQEAFRTIGEAELEELGQDINSWWSVDAFARILAGPAWLKGQASDELIHRRAQVVH